MNNLNNDDDRNNKNDENKQSITNYIEENKHNSFNKEQINFNNEPYIQEQKNTNSTRKTFLIFFSVTFIILGFMFFMMIGFFSTIFYYEVEQYDEQEEINELINKGENSGYIFTDRHNIDYFSNIYKVKRTYNPIKEIDNYNYELKVKKLKPYLYKDQEIEPLLIEHGISSYMTEKGTEPLRVEINNPKNKPVVCIQDWFNDGDNHGEYISSYIQSLYDGPIYLIDNNSINFNIFSDLDFYDNCDIVNMSIGYSGLLLEKKFLENFGEVLKKKDTIFIYAAGNDYFDNSEDEQELTYFKNKIKNSNKEKYNEIKDVIPNYFISVTQGLVGDEISDTLAYRIYSGGEGVDLIVLNGDIYVDYNKLSGTSFATPVATAMAANLLTAGVPKGEVLDYLKSDYVLKDEYEMDYPILLIDDIQNKVNNLNFYNN